MAVIRFPPKQSFVMKPHVQRFADDLEKHLGGAMNFGTYKDHSLPEGPTQALDIFNPNSPNGHKLQDQVCDFARRNAKKYGVRYCIRRAQIWNIERDAEGWRNQRVTGNQTDDHMDHVHVTFYASAPSDPTPPPAPAPPKEDQLFSASPIASVHIVAGHSGLLLTSTGARHGAEVVQAPADGSLNQRWQLVGHRDGTLSLVNRAGDLALDRPDYKIEAGTFLQVARTEHNAAQRWRVEYLGPVLRRMWVPGTNRLVDVDYPNPPAGALDRKRALLWYGKAADAGPENQLFTFARTV